MTEITKQRHGCVTAWLILMIILNSLVAFLYLFFSDFFAENLPGTVSKSMLVVLAILGIANVVFAVLLFNWKKIGFWGFLVSAIATFIVNLKIGLGLGQSLFGLVGLGILYGILQIKKNNISTWQNLEPQSLQDSSKKSIGFKSSRALKKERLEVAQQEKEKAEEEAERIKKRKEKEDPNRFMPK